MGQKKVWLLAGGVGVFLLLLELALGAAVTALVFQQPFSSPPAVESTPTPTSEWTKPNRSGSGSNQTDTQPRTSPSQSATTTPAPRPTRDAAAAAQLQALRAECQARNSAREAEAAAMLLEIQQLEVVLGGYESELAQLSATKDSPDYWNYDLTQRQEISTRIASLEGNVISLRGDIDYKNAEIRLLATAYEDCIY